jgi:hypothetical protein
MPEIRRFHWLSVGSGLFALLACEMAAIWLLTRLKQRRLFVMSLPWDAPASMIEEAEASDAAQFYQLPAVIVIAVLWGLAAVAWRRRAEGMAATRESLTGQRLILGLFLVGTVADIVTTLIFFHRDGVDHELHPGIRLASYALGRSIGPVVTKSIQFAGVLLIASLSKKTAPYVIGAAGGIYLLGAFYNVWMSAG